MSDLTTFETELAAALERYAGPRRPVDAVALTAEAAARPVRRKLLPGVRANQRAGRVPWRLIGAFALLAMTLAGAAYMGGRRDENAVQPVPGASGLITYQFHGDIYVADLGTGRAAALSSDPAAEHGPAFSPDGKLIAFTRDREERPPEWRPSLVDVVVMKPDGSGQRVVSRPTDSVVGDVAWAPDSRSIIMNVWEYIGSSPTLQLDVTGSTEPVSLTPPYPIFCGGPCVRPVNGLTREFRPPAGDVIAIGGYGSLRLFDVATRTYKRIGQDALRAYEPYWTGAGPWSPDGSKLALRLDHASSPTGTDAVVGWFVISADGLTLQGLGGKDFGDPVWSPDGSLLAVTEGISVAPGSASYCPDEPWIDSCGAAIWLDIVDAETGARRPLDATRVNAGATTSTYIEAWSWSPDGRSLLVTTNVGTKPQLVDVATGSAIELPWVVDSAPSWQPLDSSN